MNKITWRQSLARSTGDPANVGFGRELLHQVAQGLGSELLDARYHLLGVRRLYTESCQPPGHCFHEAVTMGLPRRKMYREKIMPLRSPGTEFWAASFPYNA